MSRKETPEKEQRDKELLQEDNDEVWRDTDQDIEDLVLIFKTINPIKGGI